MFLFPDFEKLICLKFLQIFIGCLFGCLFCLSLSRIYNKYENVTIILKGCMHILIYTRHSWTLSGEASLNSKAHLICLYGHLRGPVALTLCTCYVDLSLLRSKIKHPSVRMRGFRELKSCDFADFQLDQYIGSSHSRCGTLKNLPCSMAMIA